MGLSDIKLPIGIIGVIIAQAFGIIWYVAQLDSSVEENTDNVAAVQAQYAEATKRILELNEKIAELEKKDAIIDNEMRTIMGDHDGFNDVLKTIGISGYGDTRTYGGYDNYK
mgnify:FL=1|jgi:hypothetical protein|tara:strand:+ start:4366 stop:4701 length:336 start_codon:yes stop_codon:yes gene_type:complete